MKPTGPRMKTTRRITPSVGGLAPTDKEAAPAPPGGGQTRPQVGGASSPRLPHEHDESADSQSSEPRADMIQAHADVERGLVDTDRGPVIDEVYEHQVRPPGEATPDRAAPAARADEQPVKPVPDRRPSAVGPRRRP